eukprot:SAG31_NODE_4445_length_3223_cov_82.165173_2_plen_72_part_00
MYMVDRPLRPELRALHRLASHGLLDGQECFWTTPGVPIGSTYRCRNRVARRYDRLTDVAIAGRSTVVERDP